MDTIGLRDVADVVVTISDQYFQTFATYGLSFGLRVNGATTLKVVSVASPFGWQPVPPGAVDVSLCVAWTSQEQPNEYRLYRDSNLVARTPDLETVLVAFNKHAELLTTYQAQDCLFMPVSSAGRGG